MTDKERYWANVEEERRSTRERHALHRDKHIADLKAWRSKNKAKIKEQKAAQRKSPQGRAQKILRGAVHYGRLVKSTHCERCGQFFPPRRIYGHHEDYNKPLEVIWVCIGCHATIHREKRERGL